MHTHNIYIIYTLTNRKKKQVGSVKPQIFRLRLPQGFYSDKVEEDEINVPMALSVFRDGTVSMKRMRLTSQWRSASLGTGSDKVQLDKVYIRAKTLVLAKRVTNFAHPCVLSHVQKECA